MSTPAPASGQIRPSVRAAVIQRVSSLRLRQHLGEQTSSDCVCCCFCFFCAEKSESGFSCPKDQPKTDVRGQVVTHPRYPHPTDCQKFYVCLNGEDPRDLGCQLGEVYNDVTEMCDAPENVPGCEDWYKEADDKKD